MFPQTSFGFLLIDVETRTEMCEGNVAGGWLCPVLVIQQVLVSSCALGACRGLADLPKRDRVGVALQVILGAVIASGDLVRPGVAPEVDNWPIRSQPALPPQITKLVVR